MLRSFIIALTALLSLSAATASAQKSVAVLGLEVIDSGSGIEMGTLRLAKSLTEGLRAQVRSGGGPYRLAPNADKGLAEMKLLAGCDNEGNQCMATIGQAVGSETLIYGKLEKTDGGAKVSLQLLDVKSARKIRGVTDLIPADQWSDLSKWSRSLYGRLAGIPVDGSLTIKSNASTGTVLIDGQVQTSLSGGAATLGELSEGRHQVAVESPGYERWNGEVSIVAGRSSNLDVTLDAISSTAGPLDQDTGGDSHTGARVAFWASLGVGAAAGTLQLVNWFIWREDAKTKKGDSFNALTGTERADVLSAAGYSEGDMNVNDVCGAASTVNDSIVAGMGTPSNDLKNLLQACDDGKRTSTLSYVFGGVAVAAGAAATYFFYKGYISDDGADERPGTVRFTPTIAPSTVGAGLSIDF